MMHLLRYYHAGQLLDSFVSEPPPFVPRVGDEFEIDIERYESEQYRVLRVVVSYPEQVQGFEHLGRTVDVRVHVFPTEARWPSRGDSEVIGQRRR